MARFEKSKSQLRAEKFIETKLTKEQETWKKCLPTILEDLTSIIKYHPERYSKEWFDTLPELRELYRKARKFSDDSKVSEASIKSMCSIINKFTYNMKLILCKKEVGGIESSYWLAFKGKEWLKPKDAIELINK